MRILDLLKLLRVINGKENAVDVKGLVTDLILSFLRHALTGGGLLGVVLSPDELTKILAIVPIIVGSLLSAWDKYKKNSSSSAGLS